MVVYQQVPSRSAFQGCCNKVYEGMLHKWAWDLFKEILWQKEHLMFLESDIVRNAYGKPYLKGYGKLHFNLSHTDGMVGCMLSEQEVGLDIERIKPFRKDIIRKVCTEEEKQYFDNQELQSDWEAQNRFFELWTLKESYIKAVGKGLSLPMKEISFTFQNQMWISKQKEYIFEAQQVAADYRMAWCQKVK